MAEQVLTEVDEAGLILRAARVASAARELVLEAEARAQRSGKPAHRRIDPQLYALLRDAVLDEGMFTAMWHRGE